MDKDVDPISDATPLDDLSVSGTGPMTPEEEAASGLAPGEAAPSYLSPESGGSSQERSWTDELGRTDAAAAIAAGSAATATWSAPSAGSSAPARSRSFFGRGGRAGRSGPADSGATAFSPGGVPSGSRPIRYGNGLPRYRRPHLVWMLAAMAAYCAFVIPRWSEAYIDFGDGNYMYIASRIAEGGVVYRDILAPQPPMHLFVGAGIVKFYEAARESLPEDWRREHPIFAFRAFSLLIHLATFLLIVRLGGRAWGRASAGVAAGFVYMALPLGLWWSLGYQSEPLEILFLVAMMNCAIGGGRMGDLFTGIFGALAAMTNATAAPFLLLLIIYMAIANWRRAVRIAVPSLLLAGAMTLLLEFYAGGTFLKNAVLNQTGTYPPEGFVDYAIGKLQREGSDIFRHEGLFILAALLGLFYFVRVSPMNGEARGGLLWFCLATMASFLYVTKGGTMDYIFCLAGPALAVMGAGLWVEVASFRGEVIDPTTGGHRPLRRRVLESGIPRLLAAAYLGLLFLPTFQFYGDLASQRAFELPDLDHARPNEDGSPGSNVEQVAFWIEQFSKPGDSILAPPFYAVLTDRLLWGDYSEIFIWTIKDHNDRTANDPNGEGYLKTLAMAEAIRKVELPIVILEMDQTGRLPEVMSALSRGYRPLTREPYRTLNTRLGVFVPRDSITGNADIESPGSGMTAAPAASKTAIAPPPRERVEKAAPALAEPIFEPPPAQDDPDSTATTDSTPATNSANGAASTLPDLPLENSGRIDEVSPAEDAASTSTVSMLDAGTTSSVTRLSVPDPGKPPSAQ